MSQDPLFDKLTSYADKATDEELADMAVLYMLFGADVPDEFQPGTMTITKTQFAWNCPCRDEECSSYAEITLDDKDPGKIQLYIELEGPIKIWQMVTLQEFADMLHWGPIEAEDQNSLGTIEVNDEIEQALQTWLTEHQVTLPEPKLE